VAPANRSLAKIEGAQEPGPAWWDFLGVWGNPSTSGPAWVCEDQIGPHRLPPAKNSVPSSFINLTLCLFFTTRPPSLTLNSHFSLSSYLLSSNPPFLKFFTSVRSFTCKLRDSFDLASSSPFLRAILSHLHSLSSAKKSPTTNSLLHHTFLTFSTAALSPVSFFERQPDSCVVGAAFVDPTKPWQTTSSIAPLRFPVTPFTGALPPKVVCSKRRDVIWIQTSRPTYCPTLHLRLSIRSPSHP
jgi:hypothetical protein